MQRPLIFSASIGHGHQRAAEALKVELENKGYQPEVIDTFYSLSPMLHKIMLNSYLRLLKVTPKLWRSIYYRAEDVPMYLWLDRFGSLFVERLYKLVNHFSVPFIISTHPFVTAFLTSLKRKKEMDIPLYTVITDFVLHPAYVRDEIDGYFTADPNVKKFTSKYNYQSNLFFSTGIPVPDCSVAEQSKWKVRYNLQLSHEKKIVLIAGGGIGLTNYVEVIRSMDKLKKQVLLLCMTGHNDRAKEKIETMSSKHEVVTIPFTDKFLDYLRASDVVVSKSGGLTMAEALLCETPILVYQPVPGHEEHNADFLEQYGAALKAEESEQIPLLIKKMLYSKRINEALKSSAKRLKKPYAATKIVNEIMDQMDKTHQAIR
ncbi:MGDG synthase family glycosyltransferase [Bacillus sp. FJAT-45350]|uniref:MGDG synthase family glycosyltransferase n=1 Tax=Bacillus sp. FJAT-45350 TaxID=2011014 RepID=UPI0015C81C00|nr:glycosyltransferase [Bacillus sp. FJAT-45350]